MLGTRITNSKSVRLLIPLSKVRSCGPYSCRATTYVHTTLRYRLALSKHVSPGSKLQSPPQLPYALPILENSLSFLGPFPGLFWKRLMSTHQRSAACCTLLLAGQMTHVLFDPSAIA